MNIRIHFIQIRCRNRFLYLCVVRYREGRDLLAVAEPVSLRTVVEILHHHHTPTGVHKQTFRNTDTHTRTMFCSIQYSDKHRGRFIFSVLQENIAQYCMMMLRKKCKAVAAAPSGYVEACLKLCYMLQR